MPSTLACSSKSYLSRAALALTLPVSFMYPAMLAKQGHSLRPLCPLTHVLFQCTALLPGKTSPPSFFLLPCLPNFGAHLNGSFLPEVLPWCYHASLPLSLTSETAISLWSHRTLFSPCLERLRCWHKTVRTDAVTSSPLFWPQQPAVSYILCLISVCWLELRWLRVGLV